MGREEIIQKVTDLLKGFYYEDLEFFYGFISKYAERKGMR